MEEQEVLGGGVDAAAPGSDARLGRDGAGVEREAEPAKQGPAGEAGEVRMTQAGLDKLIDKAYARGVRKGTRNATGEGQPEGAGTRNATGEGQPDVSGTRNATGEGQPEGAGAKGTEDGAHFDAPENGPEPGGEDKEPGGEALALAEAQLAEAGERLLAASVRGAAAGLGITGRGGEAALRLCDFSACFAEGGLPDEAAVAGVLEAFVSEWPEFAAAAPPPPFAAGTGTAPVMPDAFRQRLGL